MLAGEMCGAAHRIFRDFCSDLVEYLVVILLVVTGVTAVTTRGTSSFIAKTEK